MKITCVVDDARQPGSELLAEHGVSFLIDVSGYQVLFDTGQTSQVLLHNLSALGLDPTQIDALVLSHGHDDHTGGMPGLMEKVQNIPLYAHPDVFCKRYRQTDDGAKFVGPAVDGATAGQRLRLRLGTEPQEIAPGLWTTGEIVSRPELEGRSRTHVVQEGTEWVTDPYRDDLSVVLQGTSGLVLLCGCCHAGLLNTLAHVRQVFGADPTAVVGGVHLVQADDATLDRIIDALRGYGPPQFWLGHCTGKKAMRKLAAAFGNRVSLCQVGTMLAF